ncbi:hypothetical protein C7974DRAFT_92938 [Boeremia exigua]|uniref:uncharacterized protein n=1 Tax=Boeremia exigua TaxID=749465 RepID=UPI001E8EDA02|nr:uncharacterized protein C7974DRAFT_92938 [Boeremia exigua]KAH6641968.1 hypothetical protein C7974DRAFT_92938 [Boeremia exigua]
MTDCEKKFNHYALLIGIDAYKEKPLKGCVQDVRAIKDLIDRTPNASTIWKCLMTAPLPTACASSTNSLELLPTYDNVKRELDRIYSRGERGNSVYIHYSGHGTAMSPPFPSEPHRIHSNLSTGDLALNLLEDCQGGIRYLRGIELGNVIARMAAKGLRVTLVLDCCFSGSVMRHSSLARFLDYSHNVDAKYPAVLAETTDPERRYGSRAVRQCPLVKPENFTVLAACGPTELAGELEVDNKNYGVLSYLLIETFRKLGGFGGGHRIIYQYLCALFQANRAKFTFSQYPMFYGNRNSFFLGQVSLLIGASPILVSGSIKNGFVLNAGKAHGICEGDSFLVHSTPGRAKSESTNYSIASFRATAVRIEALISHLELHSQPASGAAELFATTLTRNMLKEYRIQIQGEILPLKGREDVLSRFPTLDISHDSHENEVKLPSFTIQKLGDTSLEIQNLYTQRTQSLQFDLPNMSFRLAELLDHLARFEMMRRLVNLESVYLSEHFGETFDIQFTRPDNVKVRPGCLKTGDFQTVCTHAECLITVNEGDSVYLEVRNKENDIQNCLCLHVYAMTSTGKIQNIFGNDYEVVPPPGANNTSHFGLGGSGLWKKRLGFQIPQGLEVCDDIIKIFITTRPTSFWSLELPKIGAVMERGSDKSGKTRNSYGLPVDWIATSLRVRTQAETI